MQEFKPLPMKDIANPAPMHPAFEKTSQWMNSFMPTVMDKIRAGSVAPTNMGMSNQDGSGVAKMLFEAVHPDTFNRVLDFIRPRGGMPKYQKGTDYVEETGPAMLHQGEAVIPAEENKPYREGRPGQIIPYGREPSPLGSVPGQITYAGMTGPGAEGPGMGWLGSSPGQWWNKTKESLANPMAWLDKQAGQFGLERKATPGFDFEKGIFGGGGPEPIGGGVRYGETVPPGGVAAPYPGPRPWTNRPAEGGGVGGEPTPLGEGWQHYGEGIDYKMGPENARGDELARQRILKEATPDLRLPFRGYYEAHPEERAADEYYARMRGPAPDSYEAGVERMREMNLMDIVKSPNTTPEARKAAAEQLTAMKAGKAERGITAMKGAGELWGKGMEYGPTSPLSQERLAHARSLEMTPWMHMAGIEAQNKAHLEGIREQVRGHVEAAQISADVKDPMLKAIDAALAMGQKNQDLTGVPANFQRDVGRILKTYHDAGRISDEQFAKIPDEYKKSPTVRLYSKGVAYDIPEEKVAQMRSKYPDLKEKQ